MKRVLLGLVLCALLSVPVTAQNSQTGDALTLLAELPGVSGYEEQVSQWLAERLRQVHPRGVSIKVEVDNLGTVLVTLGAGTPRRLLVTHIDEPGYVTSNITDDGYLRVQRLPQGGVHPWFDLLHATWPVQILSRRGKLVPGVVAGLSTHLHRIREPVPARNPDHLDQIYIDVGARSRAGARALGIDLLDPITLEKHAYRLGNNEITAPFISDRAGAAALVRLLERLDGTSLQGTLTVAFVVRRYLGNQGLDRIARQVEADEVIFVQRVEGSEAQPGTGVLLAPLSDGGSELVDEMAAKASEKQIPATIAPPQRAPRGRYTGVLPLPARAAVVGVPVKFPQTPAEIVSQKDIGAASTLLAAWLGTTLSSFSPSTAETNGVVPALTEPPVVRDILRELVEVYGVSGYEEPVLEKIKQLLPEWAREWATVDGAGNLIVPFGRTDRKPRLVFVAHMDEIGWVVREITDEGRLLLDRRGGFRPEYFWGHAVLVHTEKGQVPVVLELPEDYRTQKFAPVRNPRYTAYTGAHTRAQAEALGIKVGDSVTVPKKFRKLGGTRVNGRSFDDRVGSTALIAALWKIQPEEIAREVVFVWAVEEEIGLNGAKHYAARMARTGGVPDYVFAVDTFVTSDSPLESARFARGLLGKGFALRAVDSSNVTPRKLVDRVIALAGQHRIPVQYGVTAGGNDGAAFVPYGSVDIPLAWPLRYSHSSGEVADLKDVEALARIVAVLAKEF